MRYLLGLVTGLLIGTFITHIGWSNSFNYLVLFVQDVIKHANYFWVG